LPLKFNPEKRQRLLIGSLFWLLCLVTHPADAQITGFQHIVLIVQENRTPDNLFFSLCATVSCSTTPDDEQYNIQTSNWLDKNVPGGTINPAPVQLANEYDTRHEHPDFVAMCDRDPTGRGGCKMDGAGDIGCAGTWTGLPHTPCPPNAEFRYVDNSTGILDPYLDLATSYGWANYMFQTNQGPSFPAHQFLFGATSAPSADDDHAGTFAAENVRDETMDAGCTAPPGTAVQLIDAQGYENRKNRIYPCFEHDTIADLLDAASVSWRYYSPLPGGIWTAPNAIDHICKPHDEKCKGSLWRANVDIAPSDVLVDIGNCALRQVSWVIPTGQRSDHAGQNAGDGPAWVASIVNAIGNSPCHNADNSTYWDSTAIIITWDDWGGWYDHEPPKFLDYPEGGYQMGFRVPLIFVSAYTPQGYINNGRLDFGTIARFIENNFGIPEGALTFADARGPGHLADFFNLSATPRTFQTIPAPKDAAFFIHDKTPPTPPDDD